MLLESLRWLPGSKKIFSVTTILVSFKIETRIYLFISCSSEGMLLMNGNTEYESTQKGDKWGGGAENKAT